MSALQDIVIIGFGNQAQAWAQNLSDSAIEFKVAVRPGPSYQKAKKQNFSVQDFTSTKNSSGVFILLTPDHTHEQILAKLELNNGSKVIYAHGYSVHQNKLNQKYPDLDHLLLAPKAIAKELRSRFVKNEDIPAFYSTEHSNDEVQDLALLKQLAKAIGVGPRPYQTTFKQECQADQFSEQMLLCGGLPALIEKTFTTLVDNGVDPKLAYYESFFEVKLIVDTIFENGLSKFFELISPHALAGGNKAFKKLKESKELEEVSTLLWQDIANGNFENQFLETNIEGLRNQTSLFWDNHLISDQFNKENRK